MNTNNNARHPWPTNDSVYVSPAGTPFKLLRMEGEFAVLQHPEGWEWKEPATDFLTRWTSA